MQEHLQSSFSVSLNSKFEFSATQNCISVSCHRANKFRVNVTGVASISGLDNYISVRSQIKLLDIHQVNLCRATSFHLCWLPTHWGLTFQGCYWENKEMKIDILRQSGCFHFPPTGTWLSPNQITFALWKADIITLPSGGRTLGI